MIATTKSDVFFAVAGYVGWEEVWDSFSNTWNDVLVRLTPERFRESGIEARESLKEYSASDCESGWGAFVGWTKDERIALTTKRVDALVSAAFPGIVGFGAAVAVEDFPVDELHERERRRQEIRFGYLLCCQTIVGHVVQHFARTILEHPIEFIFDNQPHLEGEATKAFLTLRNAVDEPYRSSISWQGFRFSEDTVPLQAAGLRRPVQHTVATSGRSHVRDRDITPGASK